LRDLRAAGAAYVEYRDSIRGPALPPAPKPWRSLDSLKSEYEASHPRRAWLWWQVAAAAAAVCLVATVVLIVRQREPRASAAANALLTRSADAEMPANRTIAVRLHGRTVLRPAVLTAEHSEERDSDWMHLEMLFTEAHYSWQDPLSARSFQAWRSGLRNKRDTVNVIHTGGPERAYRVQTDAAAGVLRSASLTLRGRDLRPTNGTFHFTGEDPLEMGETTAPAAPADTLQGVPARKGPPEETPASPADTLHVLAALNRIGADVGEPIDVSQDAQHQIVVRATGLRADRKREVAAVLQKLPRVKVDLDAAPPTEQSPTAPAGAPERYSSGMPELLRQQLESRLGGAIALQQTTDRVLEASGTAVSRAHAVGLLASKFPPPVESSLAGEDRELLHRLQRGHMDELRRLTEHIRTELQSLLPAAHAPEPVAGTAWQARARELVIATQKLDELLNRLLAGSYSQSSGEAMLRELSDQMERLDQMIPPEQEEGR
ncbi:MAG TPA: hypothetical protein VG672_14885, partial [Bryobacteraceae bacterium]|nr:hypothetical protein [Bryobacteraceae bacterium]